MADINQTAAWVTARLTELGNATNDGLNTLVTDSNIGNYNAKNVTDIVPVAKGGTGASDPAEALNNLGAMPINDVSEVGKTGDYDDLLNKPTIPTISNTYDSASTDGMSGVAVAQAITASDTAMLGNVAADFSTATAYTAGDYCVHEGELYVFTADKAAGAWDASAVSKVSISDVLKKNTFDIADIEDGIYTPGDITWADFANTEYPLGWRQGSYAVSTGTHGYSNAYIRTVKKKTIDWDSVDHFTVTAPEGYYVHVTEYVSADDSFVTCHGRADSANSGRTTSVSIKVTKGHYYLFTIGKQTNLFNYVDAAFVASIILETYVNKADLLDKALYDIVADEYDPTKTYAVGDYCLYDLALYQCNTAITVAEAFNSAHWTQVNVADRLPTKVEDGVLVIGDAATGEATGLHGVNVFGGNYELVPEAFANLAEEYDPTATYMIGDLCLYDRVLHRCKTAILAPEAWESTHWEEKNVEELLELKANTDGYYEEMAVGSAEQLISTVFIEDSEPYNFRKTGGSANVGNREYDTVVGGSLVWNQKLNHNSPTTKTSHVTYNETTHEFTVAYPENSTSTGNVLYWNASKIGYVAGHVYYSRVLVTDASNYKGKISFRAPGIEASYYQDLTSKIFTTGYVGNTTGTNKSGFQVARMADATSEAQSITFIPIVIDLTLMFGTTIADYILSLGHWAGAEFVNKLFPKDYYEYNAGGFQHVNTSAHEMIGFNQFNENALLNNTSITHSAYGYSGTITNMVAAFNDVFQTIDFVPGKDYSFTITHNAQLGDVMLVEKYGEVSYAETIGAPIGTALPITETISVPSKFGGRSLTGLSLSGSGAATWTASDICLHLSGNGERDGEYEPYQKHTYPLDSSLTLRGIPKKDDDGKLYYSGDIYEYDGTVTRKYAELTVVTVASVSEASTGIQAALIRRAGHTGAKTPKTNGANILTTKGYQGISSVASESGYIRSTSTGFYVYDNAFTDLATAQSLLEGMVIVYEVETPETEQATPYTHLQTCEDYGTERYVDYAYTQGTRSVEIPVGHNTEYMATNLRNKLQSLPEPSSMGDGQYLIQQTNDQMSLSTYIPPTPTEQTTTDTITIPAGGYEVVQFDGIVDIPFSKVISSEIELDSGQGDYAPLVPYILAYSVSPTDESKCTGVVYVIHNVGEQDALVNYIIHFRYWLN